MRYLVSLYLVIVDNFKVHIELEKRLKYNANIKIIYLLKKTNRLVAVDLSINNLVKKESLREIGWNDKSNHKLSKREITDRIIEAWN